MYINHFILSFGENFGLKASIGKNKLKINENKKGKEKS